MNVKIKNEFVGITSDLVAQNNSYFVHMQTDPQNDHAPILLVSVLPFLAGVWGRLELHGMH